MSLYALVAQWQVVKTHFKENITTTIIVGHDTTGRRVDEVACMLNIEQLCLTLHCVCVVESVISNTFHMTTLFT